MIDAPSFETRMDDVRAVMDAVGSRRAVLMGVSEGAPMSALFAATYPDRVSHLILLAATPSFRPRTLLPVRSALTPSSSHGETAP